MVGHVGWDQFDAVTKAASQSALRTLYENNLMQWYRWSLGLDLRERLVCTLGQLCSNFGVMESRGTLLLIHVSHQDLADLVGASRPRVTELLAELEREHLIVRHGRQLIVCLDRIENSSRAPARITNRSFGRVRALAPPQGGPTCVDPRWRQHPQPSL